MVYYLVELMSKTLLPVLLFCSVTLFLTSGSCSAIGNTTITSTQYLTDPQTLTSYSEIFKLGFFNLPNSGNRYVGIWYNQIPVQNIVWVANRGNPLNDSTGVIRIADDGNLVVLDERGIVLWTTNVFNISLNNSSAEILDSGNLVLRQANDAKNILWQSFENPTDTFLPTMMIGGSRRTGKTRVLTSWKSENDPAPGLFFAGLELSNIPQLVIWNGSTRYWRSGPWNSRIFIGIPQMDTMFTDGFNIDRNSEEGTLYMTYSYYKFNKFSIVRHVLNHLGVSFGEIWDERENKWSRRWSTVDNGECDTYGKCGPFGVCNMFASPICSCLKGYTPKSIAEWSRGYWSGGCVRKTELWCVRNSSNSFRNEDRKKADGFLKLETTKVPDSASWLTHPASVKECEQKCVKNCSCLAYSYDNGAGCMTWSGNLVDIQKFSRGGLDLLIRVDHSELDEKKNLKVILIITVLLGTIILVVCTYFCLRWIAKQRGKQKKDEKISLIHINSVHKVSSDPNMFGDNPDLRIFKFEELVIATRNFCEANKLGEGGFGQVYKGTCTDNEQEIAVKRLLKGSLQASEEFKNEVILISKLQHRNLVRLLGCCVEGEEKMLV